MKICITSTGENLNSPIDPRFGRAQFFLLLNKKGELEDSFSNPAIGARGGAGIAAAQEIVNKDVKILITGNIGPNAFGVLNMAGIQIFLAPTGNSCIDIFRMWKEGELNKVKTPSVPGHFGMGRGGRGRTRRSR